MDKVGIDKLALKKNFFNAIYIVSLVILLLLTTTLFYRSFPLAVILLIDGLFAIYFFIYLFLINKYNSERILFIQKNKILENHMKTIIESMPELVCILDTNSKIILLNSRFKMKILKILGIEPKLGMSLEDIMVNFNPDLKKEIINNWKNILNGKETIRIRQVNNKSFEISSNCIRNEKNKVIGTIHLIRDISTRIKQEKKLEYLNKKLVKEMEQMDIHNKKMGLLIALSDTFQACLTLDEVALATASYGKRILDFTQGILYTISSSNHLELRTSWGKHENFKHMPIDPEKCWAIKHRRAFYVLNPDKDLICDHLKHNPDLLKPYMCIPLTISAKILGLLYLELNMNNLKEEQHHLISAVTEATTLALSNMKLREQLIDQSIHDSLTGLYNRRYLEEFLLKLIHQSKREHKSICLIMFDLDNFKILNDKFGHEAGDIVLKEISLLFKSITRGGDVACRWGGEEFIWLMNNCTLDYAIKRTEELRNKIANMAIEYGTKSLDRVTVSFGISTFPVDALTPNKLIDLADQALYVAKNRGRNQIAVYSILITEKAPNNNK